MPIIIRSIDFSEVKIEDSEFNKMSLWCFGDCLTEKEKELITGEKAGYLVPSKNMGLLSCRGMGGIHNVSFLGSEGTDVADAHLVWQFEILAHKDAIVELKEGDQIFLESDGEKVTD